ncbi:MAG: Gfo/Idh/MocA family oxidoreductase [Segetibacter sp.]
MQTKGITYTVYGKEAKKTVKDFYHEAKSFDSLEEMLADKNIELIIINTPNATHFDYSKKALLAGKHVIVEKAFCYKQRRRSRTDSTCSTTTKENFCLPKSSL